MSQAKGDFIRHLNKGIMALPALAWAGLIYWLSDRPGEEALELTENVSRALLGIQIMDLFAHAGLYFVLSVFSIIAIYSAWNVGKVKTAALVLTITVTYGFLDELHQSYVPGRTESIYDVMANTVGSVSSVLAWFLSIRFINIFRNEKFHK